MPGSGSYGGIFLVEVPFFWITLACVKLTLSCPAPRMNRIEIFSHRERIKVNISVSH